MEADLRLAAIAARRHSVVTAQEAVAAGVTHRMLQRRVAAGRLGVLYPGVFRIAGSTPTWEQLACGAWLAAGKEAVVSHAGAAALLGIPNLPRTLEISVPTSSSPALRGVRIHRVSSLDNVDRTIADGIAVTTPTRTVLDLCGRLSVRTLGLVVDHCLVNRLTSVDELVERQLALGRRGRKGVARLDDVLASRPTGARARQSVLETDLFDLVGRLPGDPPVPQYPLTLRDGRVIHLDVAWPGDRVGIEAQSYRWHAAPRPWATDVTRAAEAAAVGWVVIPVTWFDVHGRPEWVLDTVTDTRGLRAT